MAEETQPKTGPKMRQTLQIAIIAVIAALMALHYAGIIDLSDFNPFHTGTPSLKACPVTSCDTGVCCHATEYDPSLNTNASVFAVITFDRCNCPNDTKPEPVGRDAVTPGGPYKICECIKGKA